MTQNRRQQTKDTKPPRPYLEVARTIADDLISRAVEHENRLTWLGFDVDLEDDLWTTVYKTVDESLYGGVSGLALFFARLWSVTGNETYATAAKGAMHQALWLLDNRRTVSKQGFYAGLTGVLWGVSEASAHLASDSYQHTLDKHLTEILIINENEFSEFDFVDGLAGTIMGLLLLRHRKNEKAIMAACHCLADQLIEKASCEFGTGLSWNSSSSSKLDIPLCGLAHGASASGMALLELWAISGRQLYRESAIRGFQYERQWFSRSCSNWPDLRRLDEDQPKPDQTLSYPTYWCHGAGGIGLSRLRAFELTGDNNALAEANAALFACTAQVKRMEQAMRDSTEDFELNVSICHGLGSILDLFLFAHNLDTNQDYLSLATQLGELMIRRADLDGEWMCGVPDGGETPGLMLGMAGVGMQFLGLHEPGMYRPVGLPSLGGGKKQKL